MKRLYLLLFLIAFTAVNISAQRKTDKLDRGLVAVKKASGVFLSWRIQADEYYDVTYNVYRNGTKINSEPLTVSNYTDASGAISNSYTVKAVVNGVEQEASKQAIVFSNEQSGGNAPAYKQFTLQDVYDRNGQLIYCSCGHHTPASNLYQEYVINEASVADLDGDGEVELMVKRINATDASMNDSKQLYEASNTTAYSLIEVYKLDGTRLWWIDCGPNMVSMSSTELNCMAFDWDMDGKAEFVMRGTDNMIIHTNDGKKIYVGDPSVNTRNEISSHTDAQYAWTRTGAEYLIYLGGSTGLPYKNTTSYADGQKYTPQTYPLLRLESGEDLAQAWGEGVSGRAYGHRASKYFMGAPYLDGRKPSLFLGRGIYTRIKMITMNLNGQHEWGENWRWNSERYAYNNAAIATDPWYAQGYHNFVISDVDGDGRDEIVYGSMTIDDNGRGLSSTGFGHGDAMHVGDFDPFRKGMEIFSCNEDSPHWGSNFRDATTAEVIYRFVDTKDDGRAMAANVTNKYPGAIMKSSHSGYISACDATKQHEASGVTNEGLLGGYTPAMSQNFRIYWDGDLLDETLDGTGTNHYINSEDKKVYTGDDEFVIYKGDNSTPIMSSAGCAFVNGTKNNPTFQGDILGDWREEIIARTSDNNHIRIYTTDIPTEYRIPCLWYDHQYRNGMATQTFVYNQPPHVSYFMGEMEGLTKVPVPNTMESRTDVTSFNSSNNGKDAFAYNTSNFSIPSGVSPRALIVDVPSTVGGSGNNNNISRSYATSTLNNSSITGAMNLVKQGDGLLKIADGEKSYSGKTDVFAGSLAFNGRLSGSPVWMNRHTTLYTNGTFNESVTMEYGSTLYVGNTSKQDGSAPTIDYGTATINTLELHEGARVVLDIDVTGNQTDFLNLNTLTLRTRKWQYGPKYLSPVFEFNSSNEIPVGIYKIGKATDAKSLENIVVEGNFPEGTKQRIAYQNGSIYLKVIDGDNDADALPEASVIMTYVDSNEPGTSYGEVEEAKSGYNKISAGKVELANSGWNCNWITYLKVDLSEYKSHNVKEVMLSFDTSGSTDNKRGTVWGIGYNSSEWNPYLTYDNADRSITTIGRTQNNSATSSTAFANISWDITEIYNNDADGVLTILIYETAAAGGYVKNPKVAVDYEYVEPEPEEPTNEIPGTVKKWDFKSIYSGLNYNSAQWLNLGTTAISVNRVSCVNSTDAGTDGVVFQNTTDSWRLTNAGLRNQGGGARTMAVPNLKKGDVVTIVCSVSGTDADVVSLTTGNATVNKDGHTYTFTMTADGALGLSVARTKDYNYYTIETITMESPSRLTITRDEDDYNGYQPGIYGIVNVERDFKVGYSSLCLPFNMTVAKFTNNDANAYVAYFCDVEEENGSTTLVFTNSDNIEANKPCIIYLSQALSNLTFLDLPVYEENAMTVTKNGWSMTGNYEANFNMNNKYGVADNIDIRRGGSSSTLNGLTAYLTGPVNGSAKARIVDSNGATIVENVKLEDEATVTAIYTINGTKVTSLQPGINILKMSDGSVRKVMRK